MRQRSSIMTFLTRSLLAMALIGLALPLAACCGCGPDLGCGCDTGCDTGCGSCCAPAATPAATPDCGPCAAEPTPEVPTSADRPPEAKPGEAWCRVWEPGENETIEERVCVQAASQRKVWIPPEYKTVPEVVCVEPARMVKNKVPGVYTTKEVRYQVSPERVVEDRDECGCCTTRTIPAKYGTRKVRVCVSPETVCTKYQPAKYKCVEKQVQVKPGFCETVCEPARYETRTKTVCVKPGKWVWKRNPTCEIPEPGLPALEVRLDDKAENGAEKGIFTVGEIVRYDLTLLSDSAPEAMPNLRVIYKLPEHLEFVRGGGDGIAISGSGQAAQSDAFPLAADQQIEMYILAKVISAPATNLVQLTASIQVEDGTEVAIETESTTLKN